MKIGLSLGGGGAKGAYQVGILKAFEEFNLIDSVETISGVSIGALNAYFYLSSKSAQKVHDAWIYGIDNNPFKEKLLPLDKETRGFFNMDIVRDMAALYIDEDMFKKSKKDLYVILTKVEKPSLRALLRKSNLEKVIVHLNKMKDPLEYVLSSAAIPVLFGFKEIDNNYYIDGGLTDNNPVDILFEKGANIIFYSTLNGKIDFDNYKDQNLTFIELTSKFALPGLRLQRFLSSADFDREKFLRRAHYGYVVTKNMIEYLISLDILHLNNGKYTFKNTNEGFKSILIPDEIHEIIKDLDKSNN